MAKQSTEQVFFPISNEVLTFYRELFVVLKKMLYLCSEIAKCAIIQTTHNILEHETKQNFCSIYADCRSCIRSLRGTRH